MRHPSNRNSEGQETSSDFIDQLRERQNTLAGAIAHKLHKDLEGRLQTHLHELAKEEGVEIDENAAEEQCRSDIAQDVFGAVLGYADWLGATIYRKLATQTSTRSGTICIPECDKSRTEEIAEKYGVDRDLVELVIKTIQTIDEYRVLHPVGEFTNSGKVKIDSEQLTRWAEHYDWS